MNIPMINETEKKKSIDIIIKLGLRKKKTLFSLIRDMTVNFGIKNIFWGVGDCITAAFLCTVCCFVLALIFMNAEYPHTTLFIITPLFYIAANSLVTWKETVSGMYDLKRSLKYTPVYLTVFRMMVFSVINILIIIPPSAIISTITKSAAEMYPVQQAQFLNLLLVSMISVLFYSLAMTAMLIRFPKFQIIFPIVWLVLCVTVYTAFQDNIEFFLRHISIFALIIFVIISAIFYIVALNKFIKKGEKEYAYS